jgi:antitoxin component YwqK of YwqJK toxin-antitoxin module
MKLSVRKTGLALFTGIVLLASCQNNGKPAENRGAGLDSAAQAAQSAINKMVDEMAPPDSNYTGDFFLKYDNGLMKVKGFFRFGKRHGQWYYFYPNGFVWSEALYDNGKMNGMNKAYHENGKIYSEGSCKQGLSVGDWNFYDTSGTKIFVRTYDSTGKVLSDKPVEPQKK